MPDDTTEGLRERLFQVVLDAGREVDVNAIRAIVAEVSPLLEGARDRVHATSAAYSRLDDQKRDAEAARDRWKARGEQAEAEVERLRAERDAARLIVEELQALRDTLYGQLDSAQAERDALKAATNELLGQRAVLLAVIDGAREIAEKAGRTGERITIALALPPMPLPPTIAAMTASGTPEKGAEGHRDRRTPQTPKATEGHTVNEASGGSGGS